MADITMTYRELRAAYPHMHNPDNRVVYGDSFEFCEDDDIYHLIEFTNLQFMAWSTQGPLTEVLTVTMCEDLVTTYVHHVVMSSMLQGD